VTPRKQLLRHRPEEGVYGDCHRTALACLLDLDPLEVPHFLHDNCGATEFNRRVDEWLASRGFCQANVAYQGTLSVEQVLQIAELASPGVYCLLGGESRTGCNHTVIACDGKIAWDPSFLDSGIVGPCSDGLYWITFLLPLSMRKAAA
jgi:hypothetical protein